MASIKFKDVVSFSSQDSVHRVFNLLEQNSQFKKWLCAAEDKSGRLQAEFQLEKASSIGFVDIGNSGSAFVEVQVRRSSWPDGRSVTMIPATMMMTPQQCKMGKNKSGVRMFTKDQLTAESVRETWDRIKVICTQPYKKDSPFGLAFIRIGAQSIATEQPSPEAPGPTMAKLNMASPSTSSENKKSSSRMLSPSWKSNSSFHRQVIAARLGEQSTNPALKNKLLKISSTSENGSDRTDAMGRAGKLVLAASSNQNKPGSSPIRQRGHSSPTMKSPASNRMSPSGSSSGGDTGREDSEKTSVVDKEFTKKVEDFLKSIPNERLNQAKFKAIRKEFEQFLGRKVNSAEKAELKSAAISAVTESMTPKSTATAQKLTPPGNSNPHMYKSNHPSPRSASTPGGAGHASKPSNNRHTPSNKLNSAVKKTFTPDSRTKPSTHQRLTPPGNANASKYKSNHPSPRSASTPGGAGHASKPSNNRHTPSNKFNSAVKKTFSSESHTWEQSQVRLPMSQRKRPCYDDGKPTMGTVAKAPRRSSGSGEKKRPLQSSFHGSMPNGGANTSNIVSPNTNRTPNLPGWLTALKPAVGNNTNSAPTTPAIGTSAADKVKVRRKSTPGVRNSMCMLCHKMFTAKGISRHEAKCTGPKRRRRSRCAFDDIELSDNEFDCQMVSTTNAADAIMDMRACPVCRKKFPSTLIDIHEMNCDIPGGLPGYDCPYEDDDDDDDDDIEAILKPSWLR